MSTLKFKTNINCGSCVAKVTPALNELTGIDKWDVNINDANKILTVESSQLTAQDIQRTLEKVGYKGEEIK
jgi:copper chaperone